MAGYWEFPGGKLEQNELPRECLKRELREELGISCRIDNFFCESIYQYDQVVIRLLAFLVTSNTRVCSLNDHDKLLWLLPHQLKRLRWAPADIPIMEKLLRMHGEPPL